MNSRHPANTVNTIMLPLPLQIRFNDIDGVGHVNNNMFGEYFDLGRMHYFEQALGEQIDWRRGRVLVLVHTEADYLGQVFLYDRMSVLTRVTDTGSRSVKMYQQIVDARGTVRVEGRSVLSTYDFDTRRSFPLPEAWREKIAAFEAALNNTNR